MVLKHFAHTLNETLKQFGNHCCGYRFVAAHILLHGIVFHGITLWFV